MLHALKMWTTVLRADRGGAALSDEQRRALEAIERILGDASVRIGQVQDSARARADVPVESLDLGEVIQQVIELSRAQVVERSHLSTAPVAIEPSLPANLPRVRGSGSELRSVFLNLILNARDAMPRGGTIRIDVGLQGESVAVTVSDEGTGIPERDLERIFDPFFTTKGGRGTGLGLSIARNVMRRLGGSISAANRAPGNDGAQFTLTFPIVEASPAAPPAPQAPSLPRAGPRRVLVIDDDPENLEALETVMRFGGHDVSTAGSGPEAIARAERGERYDLVLCDLGMPGMNGWDVVARLRALAPEAAVYIITGWAHEIAAEDPRRATVAGVLAKPLDIDELDRVVTGCCA
jgi:CheY-like chemotaxis protein